MSDGWVRCGRCDKVFDALDNLIDLDPPAAAAKAAGIREPRAKGPATAPETVPIDIQRLLERQDQDSGAEPADPERTIEPANELAQQEVRHVEPPAATQASDLAAAPEVGSAASPGKAVQTATAIAHGAVPSAPAAPVIAPAFMQIADRQARWNSPAMRAALLGTSLILLIMLMMQVVHHQRDSIAAHSPTAAAVLRSACERWNCRIEALRRIGDLSIESSALSKIAGEAQSVKLTMSLRNRGALELAMPAVELSLTDAQGKLIARKALLPQDFNVDPPRVEAGAALPLQLVLSTGETRIAGYTVELFYP